MLRNKLEGERAQKFDSRLMLPQDILGNLQMPWPSSRGEPRSGSHEVRFMCQCARSFFLIMSFFFFPSILMLLVGHESDSQSKQATSGEIYIVQTTCGIYEFGMEDDDTTGYLGPVPFPTSYNILLNSSLRHCRNRTVPHLIALI